MTHTRYGGPRSIPGTAILGACRSLCDRTPVARGIRSNSVSPDSLAAVTERVAAEEANAERNAAA